MNENGLIIPYLLLLISALPFLSREVSISAYIQGNKKLGLHEGTPLLLSHLLKGSMIFFLFQFISNSSLIWGILFTLFIFPFTILYEKWIRTAIRRHLNNPNHTPLTFFRERSAGRYSFHFILLIMALISLFAFLSEITWMTLLTANLFQVSERWVFLSLLFLVYVYAVAGGFSAIRKVSRLLNVFTFFIVVCLLLYAYLTNGIFSIYHRWTMQQARFDPDLFSSFGTQSLWLFVMISVYFGYLLTNLSLWHISFSMKENRIRTIYRCAVFCFASLIVTLMMIAVFARTTDHGHLSTLISVLNALSHFAPFFAYFLIASLLSIGLISAIVSLKSIMDAFLLIHQDRQNENHRFFKKVYAGSLLLLIVLFAVVRPSMGLLFTSIKLFSLLCIASIPSFSLVMLSRKKISGFGLLPVLSGFLAGLYLFSTPQPILFDLCWSLMISVSLQFFIWICQVSLQKE